MMGFDKMRQINSIYRPRHTDISKDGRHVQAVFKNLYCFSSAIRFDNIVPASPQIIADVEPNQYLIFDHEYGFSSANCAVVVRFRSQTGHSPCHPFP